MAHADANLTHWGSKISMAAKRPCGPNVVQKYPHPGPILRGVWKLALMRTGWSIPRMQRHIGIGYSRRSMYDAIPSEVVWQKLCIMGGLPKGIGITLYAKCFVPPELCHYIGCTVYAGKRKTPWKAAKTEYLELLNTLIRLAGHGAPLDITALNDA